MGKALPPIEVCQHDIPYSINVLLDVVVDRLARLRKLRLGYIPIAVAFLEHLAGVVEGFLGRHAALAENCDEVVGYAFSLHNVNLGNRWQISCCGAHLTSSLVYDRISFWLYSISEHTVSLEVLFLT